MDLSAQGPALTSPPPAARCARGRLPCQRTAHATDRSRLALQKPELAATLLLVLLVALFQIRSAGVFLDYNNLRGILGFLPSWRWSRSASRC